MKLTMRCDTGLEYPQLFSSMAVDLSASETSSLIRAYLGMPTTISAAHSVAAPPPAGAPLPRQMMQEILFAHPADLAALLKWTLSRLGKILAVPIPTSEPNRRGDVQEETAYVHQRGFIDLDVYQSWREEERAYRYPPASYTSFSLLLGPSERTLLLTILHLLSSTAAYSHKNGMTPSRLAKLFGPLLFGLPEDDTFQRTYDAHVRASNATEHLLLAFIRLQGVDQMLPTRLSEHVRTYPAMLPNELDRFEHNLRTVPVTFLEANVRMYSPDLLATACQLEPATPCSEWDACKGQDESFGMLPQFAQGFCRLINWRGGVQGRKPKYAPQASADGVRSPTEGDLDLHSSLASKEWGDFASSGFLETDASTLNFDLKESERKSRTERPLTQNWSDFETAGFGAERDESGLDDVLSFDDQLKADLERWPQERAEILEKLRKTAKKLPDFPYDTSLRLVASPSTAASEDARKWSSIDESFAEVWADYLIGCGWSNRDELTHRTSSFAVVQYKSRPAPWTVSASSSSAALSSSSIPTSTIQTSLGLSDDPRTDAAWFVISEVCPTSYRAALEAYGRKRSKSKSALKKLNIFKRIGQNAAPRKSGSTDPHDVFQPGRGGTTKQLSLISLGSDRASYIATSGVVAPAGPSSPQEQVSQFGALRSDRPPTSVSVREQDSGSQSRKSSGSFLTALRSKSQRLRKAKEVAEILSEAPLVPPKKSAQPTGLPTSAPTFASHESGAELQPAFAPVETASHASHSRHRVDTQDALGNGEPVHNSSGSEAPTLTGPATPPRDTQTSPLPARRTSPFGAPDHADTGQSPSTRNQLSTRAPTDSPPAASLQRSFSGDGPRGDELLSPQESAPSPPPRRRGNYSSNRAAESPAITPTEPAPESIRLRPVSLRIDDEDSGQAKTPTPTSPGTGSRVAALRASLNPLDVPAKDKPSAAQASGPAASRENPFDKERTRGRVAKIAGQFGGPAKPTGALAPAQISSNAASSKVGASAPVTPPAAAVLAPAVDTPSKSREGADPLSPGGASSPGAGSLSDVEQLRESSDAAMPVPYREPYQVSAMVFSTL